MSKIEFNCSACGTELRVDQMHAGKKARCPKCGMIHNVPGGSVPGGSVPGGSVPGGSVPGGAAKPSSHPGEMPTHVMGGKWELRGADGQVYGPVEKSELDEWAREGRVSASCYLRQEGGDWFPAEQLYPQLSGASPVQPGGPQGTPFYVGDEPGAAPTSANPFAAPAAPQGGYAPAAPTGLQPHNGGAILTCGILGIVCCGIFGIIAWVMGSRDLAAINRGEMDPSGKSMVTAGYVMGIIAVVLHIGAIALQCLIAAVDGF